MQSPEDPWLFENPSQPFCFGSQRILGYTGNRHARP